ncbi:hypothetical protein [Halalkalicoccus subterraneus]|uniref:hypothetical protein n=1 Tax=Halalkalicoccus subterraneus TaxID=2675002 RepID=UPI0013CE735A|nr:hypothetical protein [Halalkalicoccus subterraneus]
MLETIDNSIEELERKIENGRIRSPERDNVRLKHHRALGYQIRTRLKIAESRDLARLGEELEERLEELENNS